MIEFYKQMLEDMIKDDFYLSSREYLKSTLAFADEKKYLTKEMIESLNNLCESSFGEL